MKLLSVAESCGEPPTCSRRDPEFSVGLSELCDLFSESFDLESNDLNNSESSTSRRQRKACRKLERYKRTVEKRRLNRVNERKRRRARAAEIANRRVYLETALDVCIDFEFTNKMSDKEIAKLARQMARVWALQKRYVGLQVTLLSPCKRFLEEGRRAITGFDSFRWKILHSRSYLENQEKRIVYMSPDASLPPLLDVLHDTIYVVGGLVDETGVGSLSRKRADGLHIDTYRLPIREYMQKGSKGTFNLMLTINQGCADLLRNGFFQLILSIYFICCPSMVENPKTEGEDFFGVERAVQIPPPGIAATPQSSEDQSGTEFIEAQYFDSLQAKEDSASSVCTEGELSFVDEQYFRKNLQTKIVRKDVPQSAENSTADRNEASDKKAATHSLEHYLKPSLHECDAEEKQVSRGTQKRMQKQPVVISQPKAAVGEDEEDRYGIEAILQRIEPVWKMSEEQLTELMCSRVIYDDENLIAFDKPYQMAYSGAPRDQAQLDRILQAIKATVAPKIERLCLIRSLDKDLSGIILFAKNKLVQTEIREKYKNGLVEQRYRTIVSRVPDNKEAIINIPLIKKMTKRNFLMRPLLPGAIGDAFHVNTEYKIINDNGSCALLQCTVKNDVTHQIRSHLGFGLGCPVIGDTKYSGPGEYLPPKLSPQAKQLLGLSGNQYRKLPLYLHLNEVCIPKGGIHSSQIYVKAPIPEFFRYTLKKLKLLKK